MKEWKVGDELKIKLHGRKETVTATIEVLEKPKKVGGYKTRWATVLVPAELKIGDCTHDIHQRVHVDLSIYKPPKKGKAKKGKDKKVNPQAAARGLDTNSAQATARGLDA